MISKELKEQLVKQYGIEAQLYQAMEELSELTVAISHLRRHFTRENINAVTGEIADVELMIEQVKDICGIDDRAVESVMSVKIERLCLRLNTPAPAQARTAETETVY